jgi:hypothetical protein
MHFMLINVWKTNFVPSGLKIKSKLSQMLWWQMKNGAYYGFILGFVHFGWNLCTSYNSLNNFYILIEKNDLLLKCFV